MDETREALRLLGLLGAAWPKERLMRTTVGRIIFNRALPEELWFVNELLDRKGVDADRGPLLQAPGPRRHVGNSRQHQGPGLPLRHTLGHYHRHFATSTCPRRRRKSSNDTTAEVEKAEQQYRRGLITEEELYNKTVELWTRATDDVTDAVKDLLSPIEGLGAMARSGATKGGINPVRQLAGMRGLMADPNGRIIPLPIRSNFREGLTALEYFLSTHGARKGLADTALRTADAGYLTRRLVDVAQDVIITEDDCVTVTGIWITEQEAKAMGETFAERIAGRFLAARCERPGDGRGAAASATNCSTEAALATLAAPRRARRPTSATR